MNSECVRLAQEYGTDLSSRFKASGLRRQIESSADLLPVVLDFEGVYTMSESFADELIGLLVASRGHDWFRENVRVCNMAPEVRLSVLKAVRTRLERHAHGKLVS